MTTHRYYNICIPEKGVSNVCLHQNLSLLQWISSKSHRRHKSSNYAKLGLLHAFKYNDFVPVKAPKFWYRMGLGEAIGLKGRKAHGLKLHLYSELPASALMTCLLGEDLGTEAERDYERVFHHHRNTKLMLYNMCVIKTCPLSWVWLDFQKP